MKQKFTIATLLMAAVATPALANTECPKPTDTALPIEDARLFVEDNVPDKDVGVHGFFGDTAWRVLCLYAPDGREIISFEPRGALGELGVAEFFFESNEPPYENWGYGALKIAFPEGDYKVNALNIDGSVVTGAARFTTVVAEAPVILSPLGSKDEEGDLPVAPYADMLVRWKPSTQSQDGRPLTMAGYEIIISNADWEGNGDTFAKPSFKVHVGPEMTELLVPKGFFDPETRYEIEIIAIEESGNQTIGGVSFFRTGA